MKAGWRVVPLGEVCTITKKQGGSRLLPYVGLEDIASGGAGLFLGSLDPQTDKSTTFEFEPKHVLYGRLRPYLNKVLLPDFVGHCSSEIFPLLPLPQLDRRFLFHWLANQQTVDAINATCTGARMPRANVSELMTFPIPLPPLDEQKRIVAVLDEAFEGLSRARANAEANLADARELFGALTAQAFTPTGKAWRSTPLGAVAEFRNGLNFTRSSKGQTIKIVGVGDFQNNAAVPVETLSEVVMEGRLAAEDQLLPGDILAVRSNGNKALIGRVMIVPEAEEVMSFSGFTIRIRLSSPQILPDYLLHYMRTPTIRDTLTSGGGGSNISNLNQGQLARLLIQYPEIDEQRAILDRVSDATEATGGLEGQYRNQITDLDTLRQSLLQKAFSGELT